MMADFAVQAEQLEMRQAAAQRELDRIAATKKDARPRRRPRSTTRPPRPRSSSAGSRTGPRAAASAAAAAHPRRRHQRRRPPAARGAAVQYALAQVGDAYVYGATGPSAFDCSGLTMMAWAQAGVGLPHSSSAQMGSGTPVSQSQLQPGDLVFYYSPVSHVGIYIGNGQIVHAANPCTRRHGRPR